MLNEMIKVLVCLECYHNKALSNTFYFLGSIVIIEIKIAYWLLDRL